MRDNDFTDPSKLRAVRVSAGRNRKLNAARAESLGVGTSQIATAPVRGSGSSLLGGGSALSASAAAPGGVVDPTYTDQGSPTYTDTTYQDSTYEGSLYKDYVNPSDPLA